MFRTRHSAKKPSNDLYAAFKKSFPNVGPGTTSVTTSATSSDSTLSLTTTTQDRMMDQRSYHDPENNKTHETTFDESDQWRFTPSMLDPNSFSFAQFANEGAADFGPSSSGPAGMFHNQAGDLHTPGMAFQLGTPLSSDDSHPTSAVDMHGFHPHLLHPQTFHSTTNLHQQRTYAPSSFLHTDSGYETLEQTNHESPDQKQQLACATHEMTGFDTYPGSTYGNVVAQHASSPEKLRYRVTLNAPTAMIKHASEIPITYLNKGQAYAISISDSNGHHLSTGPIKYRTVIRISFEDEQQRQRPSTCWQLWKEGRGLAEAHQRGGRLQAVEYVDANQNESGDKKSSRVELDMASFDSFAVTWSPTPGSSTPDCTVAVRFNFLSTDFSHSKGVKGIPVRLCAKTEIISSGTPESPPGTNAEVSFCKVKLFRDHGAERKLSNDIAHIKKTIDKLKQQVSQVEAGVKDVGKRKRSDPVARQPVSHKAGKAPKHKRTWSVSSQGSSGRPTIEDDLHVKLTTMQDMFSSTRPVSVLYLKGCEQDDPDLYPVTLPGEPLDLTKSQPIDRRASWETDKPSGESTPTNARSPTSTNSGSAGCRPQEQPVFPKSITFENQPHLHTDWDHFTHVDNPNFAFSPTTRIARNNANSSMPHWIEAFGVDHSYAAPQERPTKPVASFYVLMKKPADKLEHDYYQAVYLMERSTKDLIQGISTKCGVDPAAVKRAIRINARGLKIIVDDEVIREMPEAQDMIVEFADADIEKNLKQEPSTGNTTPKALDYNTSDPPKKTLEMRLMF